MSTSGCPDTGQHIANAMHTLNSSSSDYNELNPVQTNEFSNAPTELYNTQHSEVQTLQHHVSPSPQQQYSVQQLSQQPQLTEVNQPGYVWLQVPQQALQLPPQQQLHVMQQAAFQQSAYQHDQGKRSSQQAAHAPAQNSKESLPTDNENKKTKAFG